MKKLLPFLLLACSGCSFLVSSTQPVTIRATDPDAELFVDGSKVGTGKATVELNRATRHSIVAKNADHSAAFRTTYEFSGTGQADMIAGIFLLFPLLGLLTDGSLQIVPSDIDIVIKAAGKATASH